MGSMVEEIRKIPDRAELCCSKTRGITLPQGVPYIGMGASYNACLALRFCGKDIQPEIASEYVNYISPGLFPGKKLPLGVLVSQSGRSTELLWCAKLFERYIAVVNDIESPLATAPNVGQVVDIHAADERYSSTSTYVNTLIALYSGLGIEVKPAVEHLKRNFQRFEDWGKDAARRIAALLGKGEAIGGYIIGSGPNIATAREAALTISESTKLPFIGMAAAQYDHGPKETAAGTVVIAINVKGPSYERTQRLLETVRDAGAEVILLEETGLDERISPISLIVPFNFLMYYLVKELGVNPEFTVGRKVTELA